MCRRSSVRVNVTRQRNKCLFIRTNLLQALTHAGQSVLISSRRTTKNERKSKVETTAMRRNRKWEKEEKCHWTVSTACETKWDANKKLFTNLCLCIQHVRLWCPWCGCVCTCVPVLVLRTIYFTWMNSMMWLKWEKKAWLMANLVAFDSSFYRGKTLSQIENMRTNTDARWAKKRTIMNERKNDNENVEEPSRHCFHRRQIVS